MRRGLSLKSAIGGGAALVISATLAIYAYVLTTYSLHGMDYINSVLMEEEALYFAALHRKNPQATLPQGSVFSGVIGAEALPNDLRPLTHVAPSRVIGQMQVFDEQERRLLVHPMTDGKTLYVFEHENESNPEHVRSSDEFIERKMQNLLIISIAVPVSALVLIALLVWGVIHPLRRLTQWSATLAAPGTNVTGHPGFSFRELNGLAESLAASVQHVKAANVREERLLRYTSHELRTPLAVLGANLQLMICSTKGELSAPLQRIQRSVLTMQGITETLLWMSREHTTSPALDAVDMKRLISDLLEDHRYLIKSRQLKLVVDIQDCAYQLPANACRIIISNLLRNALQYADEGSIEVTTTAQYLLISNRAAHDDPREESADFGYGLGLELVQNLCEKLNWHMQCRIENRCHTVRLTFAPAPRKQP